MKLSRRRLLILGGAVTLGARPVFSFSLPSRPVGAPRPSDVCFSSRSERAEALSIGRAFGATRLDWCYTTDSTFVTNAKSAGMSIVGGALNPVVRAENSETNDDWIVSADGRPVVAPWMKGWGVYWTCANSPETVKRWLSRVKAAIDAGVDYLLIDDAGMNASAVKWGGCYCRWCRDKASRIGVSLDSQMEEFQRESVITFHKKVRAAANSIANRVFPFAYNCSANVDAPLRQWFSREFDFRICEIESRNLDPIDIAARLISAELVGQPQVLTLRSKSIALNRSLAAWCYANGGHMLAPWDVFLRATSKEAERFYGKPEDYAAIFPFAKQLGRYLDDAAPSALPEPGAWATNRDDITASLRMNPHKEFAVLHLVSWRKAEQFNISIDPDTVAGSARVDSARLMTGDNVSVELERRGNRLYVDAPPSTWCVVELRLAA